MAVDPPVLHFKFGQGTTASTSSEWYLPSTAGYYDEYVAPEERKRAARKALILAWKAARSLEGWLAARVAPEPMAIPPKARTEWGMVHRERCVHRMGLN